MFMLFGTIHEKPVNFFLSFFVALLCFASIFVLLPYQRLCFAFTEMLIVYTYNTIQENSTCRLAIIFSTLFRCGCSFFFFFCFLFANFFLSICFHFFVFIVLWAVLHLIVCSCCCENNAVVRKVFEIRNFNVFNESQAYTYMYKTHKHTYIQYIHNAIYWMFAFWWFLDHCEWDELNEKHAL